MATKDDIRKSRELEFSYDGTVIGRVSSFSLSVDGETVDVSDFDTGEWSEFLLGRKTWTASLTAHRVEDDGIDQQNALTSDFIDTATEGSISIGPASPATDDVVYSGTVIVTNFTIDASGSDDPIESSWEFQGTGALTRTVTV